MKGKKIAALALLPFGLFASAQNIQETAAAEAVVAYTSSGQSNNNSMQGSQYDGSMQMQSQHEQQDQRYGVSISGDYLYFVPYFSRMPYAQQDNSAYATTPDPSGVLVSSGTTQEIKVAGDSGYRLTGTYQSDWQTVGFTASWTSMHTTHENRSSNDLQESLTTANQQGVLTGYWNNGASTSSIPSSNTDVITLAKGKMKIRFDEMDFIFTTFRQPTDWAKVTFGVGLRSLLTKFVLTATQVSNRWGNSTLVIEPPFNTAQQVLTQKFNTVGLVGTAGSSFDIYEGFRFVSGMALAFNVGNTKVTNNQSVVNPDRAVSAPLYDYLGTTIKPQFDADVAFQYEWINDEKTFGLLLEIGYEVHYIPNLIQFVRSNGGKSTAEYSDFALQVLRVRAGISF